ncbi:MAG: sigma-70 family RNA polymerase sigma factor [Piscinibacter sp.]|uniref:ECF-type sigma factor n=1 Tax=Piscinibacter TaxID=1114981 RepID=UPI000FDEB1C1|nr:MULTISPECIES: ECF-type sigma factor [Piscinibacter]MCW5664674.1 sigma-70 family RNA polymerase sigma factor [Piscinibacter sp.]
MGDITQLIAQARSGDRSAFDSLFQLLYPELRRIAHGRLARNVRDTLMSTTALVHECYLKLLQSERLKPEDRAHFLAYAASAMRSIVVDTARASLAERRGGAAEHLPLDTGVAESVGAAEEQILDVDVALGELAQLDPRLARVVEMRYFGGMKDTEIAEALGLTDRTVRRDWEKARLLLAHALRD